MTNWLHQCKLDQLSRQSSCTITIAAPETLTGIAEPEMPMAHWLSVTWLSGFPTP